MPAPRISMQFALEAQKLRIGEKTCAKALVAMGITQKINKDQFLLFAKEVIVTIQIE